LDDKLVLPTVAEVVFVGDPGPDPGHVGEAANRPPSEIGEPGRVVRLVNHCYADHVQRRHRDRDVGLDRSPQHSICSSLSPWNVYIAAIMSRTASSSSLRGQVSWHVSSLVRISGPMKANSSPTSDCRQAFLGNSDLPSRG